ncbi:HesA/MoeB/ThiF family protein [Acetohalobium arabaticum]|uniref:UBA/THIF-type NAD/FAD binding protein n=1 Tax=Acetohalobium arabaticum (strain ATCC 49924 / DSM 5501 / Z-7288) TaxID=574087 RepID=D9QT54_ACEAZ|nr:HesA/MoeB/ThiF family protein [Acetohalobium arabaticum]ADL13554.1 UBA/THIF-type NAD/FAD binding protein [Acetohalobium arabaticum DSM 5501]
MGDLNKEELKRYTRQINLEEIGRQGQQRLKESSILVVGAGGLGSAAIYYLAAAGIGRLGIIDYDEVEVSNLQRQILHTTADIGRNKVDSAKERIEELNPHLEVVTYDRRLTEDNGVDLVKEYDLVVDAVDNFTARYLVNDVCVEAGIPLVEAAVEQYEGQLMLVDSSQGPCYRCIFPEKPKKPETEGVAILGITAGTIGTLQATEALKFILGIGETMIGKLLIYDGLDLSIRKIRVKKNPDCLVCNT